MVRVHCGAHLKPCSKTICIKAFFRDLTTALHWRYGGGSVSGSPRSSRKLSGSVRRVAPETTEPYATRVSPRRHARPRERRAGQRDALSDPRCGGGRQDTLERRPRYGVLGVPS